MEMAEIGPSWRPFTYDEAKDLVSNLGFTIVDSTTDFEQKLISEWRLKVV